MSHVLEQRLQVVVARQIDGPVLGRFRQPIRPRSSSCRPDHPSPLEQ